MNKLIIAGIGTDVGKTLVSAILMTAMEADYWKPVECGDRKNRDSHVIKKLIEPSKHHIFKPAYSFEAPLSPHHAARLENVTIDLNAIVPPLTQRPLIIEGVGGIYVPLTSKNLSIDLFQSWNFPWIVVSRHYLGSINHTLLTLDALKKRRIHVLGLIFNGEANPDSENAILKISKLPFLERLLPEPNVNLNTIQQYAQRWKTFLPPKH